MERDTVPYFLKFMNERRFTTLPNDKPCKSCFPKFYDAHKFEIVLDEGSCLYIPKYWFHMVFSDEANPKSGLNIAINTWFELDDNPLNKKEIEVIEEKKDYKNTELPMYEQCESEKLMEHSKNNFPFIAKHGIPDEQFMNIETLKNLVVDKSKKALVYTSKTNCFDSNLLTKPLTKIKQQSLEHFLTKSRKSQADGEEYHYISSPSSKNAFTESMVLDCVREKASNNTIDVYTWINFGNVYTICHYDGRDNFLCQLHGKKRIILIPPFEVEKLYPYNPYPLKFLEKINENKSNIFQYQISCLECINLLSSINVQNSIVTHFEESYEKFKALYTFVFKSVSSIVENIPDVTITPLSPFAYIKSSEALQTALHPKTCIEVHCNKKNDFICKSTFTCLINTDTSGSVKCSYGSSEVVLDPFRLCIIQKDLVKSIEMIENTHLSIVLFDIGIKMDLISDRIK